MVKITKQCIERVGVDTLKEYPDTVFDTDNYKLYSPITIEHSIIGCLDLSGFHIYSEVMIHNCIIEELKVAYCRFYEGLIFSTNLVINSIDYQAGGHNKKAFVVEDNIFYGFFNFFDCHFEAPVFFNRNILLNGSNLLGDKGKGWENLFNSKVVTEKNIGAIDINEDDKSES